MKLCLKFLMLVTALGLLGCQAKYDVDGEFSSLLARNELLSGDTPPVDVLTEIGAINDNGEIVTALDEVLLLCHSRPQQTRTQTIRFDPPGETCRWGQDGNLNPSNSFLQARTEQQVRLNIPEGAIPCDMTLSFPAQQFRYDDHFALTLNTSVLAASYNFTDDLDRGTNGLLKYDWAAIAGNPWDTAKEQVYCPVIDGERLLCEFPGHDEVGPIQVALGTQHVLGAVSNGTPINGSYFQMVTIGDNDTMDCEHTGMEFDVKIKYIQ